MAFAKFDETVELTVWLGVDPRKADQLVRGTLVLPHGLGKSKKVLVIAQGEKIKEAEEAGADYVGGEDMVNKIKEGWLDFDAVVSTPDMMRLVGGLGKVLGPRGLMPNPKTGTVTFDVRSEEHTSELQSPCNRVCRLLLEKKKYEQAGICKLELAATGSIPKGTITRTVKKLEDIAYLRGETRSCAGSSVKMSWTWYGEELV